MAQYPVVDVVNIPLATGTSEGLMSAEDKVKLDGLMESGGPFIGSLDDVPDSGTRLAMTPDERAKLAAMTATQGLTGDAQVLVHATRIDALEVASAGLTTELAALEAADTALGTCIDALEATDVAHATGLTELSAGLADLQNQIIAGSVTRTVLSVTDIAAVDMPDTDVIYIEHTVNANVRIPASWTKKPHTLVLLGSPNTVNVSGASGSGQSVKGASGTGLTFSSGTDEAAVVRTVDPDPDTANFPNRWRIF